MKGTLKVTMEYVTKDGERAITSSRYIPQIALKQAKHRAAMITSFAETVRDEILKDMTVAKDLLE
jgi:hypothetical protein